MNPSNNKTKISLPYWLPSLINSSKHILSTLLLTSLISCGGSDSSSDSTSNNDNNTTPVNSAPIAAAGDDLTTQTGSSVELSASASSDSDGDSLTYQWTFSSIPTNSTAILTNGSSETASFTADVDGDYAVSLIVNDGTVDSTADEINITASTITNNTIPVANAGGDQNIFTESTIELSGKNSTDSDNDTLSYSWSIVSAPTGSAALLSSADTVTANIVPDASGSYVISLVVSDSVSSSTSDTMTITASINADFYTPAPIIDALQLERDITWTELRTTPENLTRFSMGDNSTTAILLLTETNDSVDESLTEQTDLASETTATDNQLLSTMFQFVELSDGSFRIVSTKHSNFALDIDDQGISDSLILRDFRSANLDESNAGYLTFSISGTSPMIFSATARKAYNSSTKTFDNDDSWVTKQIALTSGDLTLTTSSGTSLKLYQPPIDFDIPFDFNPDEVTRVSNDEITPESKEDLITDTASKIVDDYADQVSVSGSDTDTTIAAAAMIAEIRASLIAENANLRYPLEFYLEFREGLFARSLQSSDSTDGVIGQLTVPYVFFTNETDSDGTHHPFMVIASFGLPDSLALLWDIAKPPGDGNDPEYDNQSVTRSYHQEAFLMKIPMRDYGEVSSLSENNMENDLATDAGESILDHHNYSSISATGVAIDGVVIYPTYNNTLHVAQTAAEISAHGMHAGKGLGVHYHADAHSAKQEGLNLYNAEDYVDHSHPPIVSMGFDGVAGYGIYQTSDTTSDGVEISLDSFGGHDHDAYGYHYHSFTESATTDLGAGPSDPVGGVEYTKHMLPPLGAWSGRINDIPEFWDGTAPNYVGGNSAYLGTQ